MDILFRASLESTLIALEREADVWTDIAAAVHMEGKQELAAGVVSMLQIVSRDIESLSGKLESASQQPDLQARNTFGTA